MQIARNSLDTQVGPSDWFTGDVYIEPGPTDVPFKCPAGNLTTSTAVPRVADSSVPTASMTECAPNPSVSSLIADSETG